MWKRGGIEEKEEGGRGEEEGEKKGGGREMKRRGVVGERMVERVTPSRVSCPFEASMVVQRHSTKWRKETWRARLLQVEEEEENGEGVWVTCCVEYEW